MKAKRKAPKKRLLQNRHDKRVVVVKEEELNAVQQAIADANAWVKRTYKRLGKRYRS